eukprot:PhM_4_TR17550/c0_g1_i1/m.35011
MMDTILHYFGGPFHEMVEQATSELLLAPDLEKNVVLSDQANLKPDNAKDIIKSIRRRTMNPNPKVNYLAVVLLGMLVKNGLPHVHGEVAKNKDLLQDLVKLAVRPANRDGVLEVKTEAIKLILSFEVWFRGTSLEGALGTMADGVRNAGEVPDTLQIDILPLSGPRPVQRSQHARQPAQTRGHHAQQHLAPVQAPRVSSEDIETMLQTLDVLADMISQIEADPDASAGNIRANELVMDLVHQVKQHFNIVATYVSSGDVPEDKMEMLLILNENQTQIMQRISQLAQRGVSEEQQAQPAPAQQQPAQPEQPPQPPVQAPAPSQPTPTSNLNVLDDLFAAPAAAPAPNNVQQQTTTDRSAMGVEQHDTFFAGGAQSQQQQQQQP